MSNQLDLKKGLDIPVKGAAAQKVVKTVKPGLVAVKPTDFKGFLPRLLVKEGDRVLAGSPVLADKQDPRILVTSPVSGTVAQVVRGEKRKLLAVLVQADAAQEYVDFGTKVPATADEARDLLLKSGLWGALIQRPYGVMANPSLRPKAIFVSSFSTAPLAADTEFTLGDRLADIQAGVNALGLLTDGGVHLAVNKAVWNSSPFHKVEHVIAHAVSGKHPAGNVGVQISHIAPIQKGETVWTMPVLLLAAFGRLINTGKLDLTRKVAVTGPVAADPAYVTALPGTPVKELTAVPAAARVIGGDALTGEILGADGYLGFFQDQLTLLHEGTEREWFGWAKPIRPKVHSSSWSYFSWLTPGKKYDMDTNLHGGPRAFVETKCFEDVTPMEIFPIFLIKACLAGDIEKMEKFGIYEVLPEDLALCDYVDPSKNDIQAIIQQGIDLMIKEMA
jgi:Na+-transporting NADH:ubiquinone oxidoreductase subunit A